MKLAAGIFAAILYLVWPYYTLLELAQAMRGGDAPTINRLVDWDQVRTSVKSQMQTYLESLPKSAAGRSPTGRGSRAAADGNAFALAMANSLVDKMLTPEGITRLAQVRRVASASASRTERARSSRKTSQWRRYSGLWRRINFAFFVSPIHFRLDFGAPRRKGTLRQPALTVMMTFKGTGWQVTDIRLPQSSRRMVRSASSFRPYRAGLPAR